MMEESLFFNLNAKFIDSVFFKKCTNLENEDIIHLDLGNRTQGTEND